MITTCQLKTNFKNIFKPLSQRVSGVSVGVILQRTAGTLIASAEGGGELNLFVICDALNTW